jgi:hypothetical protein
MKEWNTLDDAFRYARAEGFVVGQSMCLLCDRSMYCAHPPGTNTYTLECLYCGGHYSEFEEIKPNENRYKT